MQTLNTLERDSIPAQAVVMTIFRKPGFLDKNAEVIELKLEAIKFLAQKSDFSTRSAAICIRAVVRKLVAAKKTVRSLAADALIAMAKATSLDFVANTAISQIFEITPTPTQL